MKLWADKPSTEYHGLRTSSSWLPDKAVPASEQLHAAADALNAGTRIAVLAGQGALAARAEVTALADRLGAPVAKALLGKAVLADDSPFTTGGRRALSVGTDPWRQAPRRDAADFAYTIIDLHVGAGQRTKRRGRLQREITIAQIRAASDKRGDIQGGKLGILLSRAFSRNPAVFVASSIALSSCWLLTNGRVASAISCFVTAFFSMSDRNFVKRSSTSALEYPCGGAGGGAAGSSFGGILDSNSLRS
jgi:Thiamine pyrophosphate enzyme, central domain